MILKLEMILLVVSYEKKNIIFHEKHLQSLAILSYSLCFCESHKIS